MEWKKVHVSMPTEIKRVYENIYKIQKNSCIAGGFLSDLYMRKPYSDIDIFIKNNEEKEKKIHTLLVNMGYVKKKSSENAEHEYALSLNVSTYIKGKWTLQIIATNHGIKQVKYFDFRFREFFYLKDTCYASKEALLDIKNKQLVIGFPSYVLKTFYRVFSFAEKYGFSIEPLSTDRLSHIFNNHYYNQYDVEYFFSKVDSPNAEKVKRYLEKFYNKYYERYILPTKETLAHIPIGLLARTNRFPVRRDLFEKSFLQKERKTIKKFPFIQDGKHVGTFFREEKLHFLINEWKKQRVRLIALGRQELYEKTLNELEKWRKDFCDVSKEYLQNLIRNAHKRYNHEFLQVFLSNYRELLYFSLNEKYTLEELALNTLTIEVTNTYRFVKFKNQKEYEDYAKGNLVLFDIPIIGFVSYNLRANKIQYYSVPRNAQWVERFIQSLLEKDPI